MCVYNRSMVGYCIGTKRSRKAMIRSLFRPSPRFTSDGHLHNAITQMPGSRIAYALAFYAVFFVFHQARATDCGELERKARSGPLSKQEKEEYKQCIVTANDKNDPHRQKPASVDKGFAS